ncbi:MAG TPA: sigma-E factor regulatory protein RseB domain-containing protein [Streptosporangiaceae bacterium]|nr:sigma-E factor regulatory protein RseB domain-containing protein [Streptosporangiaceae bacterium]
MVRRVAIAAGVIALLTSGMPAAGNDAARAPRAGQRRPVPPAGNQAGIRYAALTFGDTGTRGPGDMTVPAAAGGWALSGAGGATLATGMRLLDQAATATRRTSYQGLQVISWLRLGGSGAWLGSGASAMKVAVWHPGGAGTLTRVTVTGTGQSYLTDDPDAAAAGGVLGLTPALLSLLAAHYAIVYTGRGSANGRPASVVEAHRSNGTLAARFWLDMATKLPLCREIFDAHAHLISRDVLASLAVGAPSGMPSITGSQPVSRLRESIATPAITGPVIPGAAPFRPWADRLGPAQLTALRGAGWPVPSGRPGGLTMFEASESSTATGKVVDLGYSDGLSDVSLFVQRGQFPAALTGWTRTSLDGHPLFVRNSGEPDVAWSAGGFAFTVVADAPAPVVAGLVNALPHQGRPGFWSRMADGIRRLLAWINPFR